AWNIHRLQPTQTVTGSRLCLLLRHPGRERRSLRTAGKDQETTLGFSNYVGFERAHAATPVPGLSSPHPVDTFDGLPILGEVGATAGRSARSPARCWLRRARGVPDGTFSGRLQGAVEREWSGNADF